MPANPDLTRVFDLLDVISSRPADEVMYRSVCNGAWRDFTVSDYIGTANRCSYALHRFGIRPGEPVLTITLNRAEFNFTDMGILQLGAVHVPLYQAIEVRKLEGILRETGARIAFISNKWILKKIRQIESCPLELLVSFDRTEGAVFYEDFLDSGTGDPNLLENLKSAVQPSDTASIIYLSGSNTPMRGVVLSHEAHVFNFLSYVQSDRFSGCKKNLSFLPLAHCLERTANYIYQYLGIQVCYSEGIASVLSIAREVRPETIIVVPLMLEKAVESIREEIRKKNGIRGWLLKRIYERAEKIPAGPRKKSYSLKRILFHTALKDLRNSLGGNIRIMICGGAALRPGLLNLFWAAGINTYEGYGLTEAGPLVSYNLFNSFKSGSVGRLMPGVEAKIAADQEVLVRSRGLMKGYYRQEHSPVDPEGWLHTGDLGSLDPRGFLTLTGIKKDLFKVSSGLYTDPRPVETLLTGSDNIKQAWIYGHNRSYLVALIIPVISKDDSLKSKEITDPGIAEAIAAYNASCFIYDQLIKYEIISDDWNAGNGLMDAAGNLDRQALYEKYRDLIENLYS